VYGCAILTAKKKTTGEIATEQGTAGKTDPGAGGILNVCFPQGAAAPTVTNTLPTTGPVAGGTGGGGGGLFGLGKAATIAIFGGIGAAALTPLFFQDNPSGSNP